MTGLTGGLNSVLMTAIVANFFTPRCSRPAGLLSSRHPAKRSAAAHELLFPEILRAAMVGRRLDFPHYQEPKRRPIMRPYSIAGLVLIVLGIVAISIRSLTYFSTEQVVGP